MVRLFDILWETKGAGPSPANNKRTELYFAGCNRAMEGNPCPNCFNPLLWDRSKCYPLNEQDIIDELNERNIPKYITIVGGEPTDQKEGLIKLGQLLKQNGYHTILFTWHDEKWFIENFGMRHAKLFNVIVTGSYLEQERIYDTSKDDGIHNVIGSGNQEIWQPEKDVRVKAGKVSKLILHPNNELEVILNND